MVEIEAARGDCPGLAALEPGDEAAVAGLFGRLSAQSIYRRFLSPISRIDQFTSSVLRVDTHNRAAVAAIAGGEVIGVAQYSRAPGADTADLAIMVADAWQRQGLGTRMVAALADQASAVGIRRFSVDVQGDNYGALRLLQRVSPGVRLKFHQGVGEGVFSICGGG